MKRFAVLCFLPLLICPITHAEASAFRYRDGKCINEQGEQGLNAGVPGQCADFRGAIVNGLNWTGIDFGGSNFESANLQRMNFQNSIFSGVTFKDADLSGANFQGARLNSVSFKGSVLTSTKWGETEFRAVDFDDANLSKTDMSFSTFIESTFRRADLTEATFEEATLTDCDFSKSSLMRAKFRGAVATGANLDGANMTDAVFIKGTFTNASAHAAQFNRARLDGADFERLNAPFASFRFADLGGTKMTRAVLTGADFSNAAMLRADLEDADLLKSKFNKRTTLPFTKEEASRRGMLLDKSINVLLWTFETDDTEVGRLLKILPALVPVEVQQYSESDPAVFNEKLKIADVLFLPFQSYSSVKESFIESVNPGVAAFLSKGGTAIGTGFTGDFFDGILGGLRETILKPAGPIAVLEPMHPLSRGLGSSLRETERMVVYWGIGFDGFVSVAGTADKPFVLWRPVGMGQISLLGYDYWDAYENPDALLLLKNALEMAN